MTQDLQNVYFRPSEKFSEKADELFKRQKARLLRVLPYADIQHVGSTSIPGSISKGDVDIQVRVPKEKFIEARNSIMDLYHIHQEENWNENFASFDGNEELLPFGIQLTVKGSADDKFFYASRDLLRQDAQLLEEYNALKRAHEGKNMEAYRNAKEKFFEDLGQRFN